MNLWEHYKAKTRALKKNKVMAHGAPRHGGQGQRFADMLEVGGAAPLKQEEISVVNDRTVRPLPHPPPSPQFPLSTASNRSAKQWRKITLSPPSARTDEPHKTPTLSNKRATSNIARNKKYLPTDAQLDLHGCTSAEALAALEDFFYRMRVQKMRHLLIITGKGTGIVKQTTQAFLEKNKNLLAAQKTPAASQGGDGAIYVLLKKSAVK